MVCGRSKHTLSCSNEAFPTTRHSDIQDLTADLLSEVFHAVSTELSLQPLTGESLSLSLHTANFDASACLDIKASGFWGSRFQPTFSDATTFNPYVIPTPTANMHKHHVVMKRGFNRLNMGNLVP